MRVRWLLLLGAVLLVAAAGQLLRDARTAEAALHRAEARLPALRDAVAAGDTAAVQRQAALLAVDARAGAAATDGPLWGAAARVPLLGASPRTAAGVAAAVQDLVTQVLPPAVAASADLRPLLRSRGGSVDVAALQRAAPDLQAAAVRARRVERDLAGLPRHLLVGPVADARSRLAGRAAELRALLDRAALAGRVGPSMLGIDGPRRWFVGFQNNAESRGTGGLVGAYAVVVADRGRVRVERLGSDADLYDLPAPRTDLGADFTSLYGSDVQLWQNTNLSPHFPYAAALWRDMWRQRTGEVVDGAVVTDPVALADVLGVTGPVRLPGGEAVSAADVVAKTEHDAYLRWPGADAERKAYLVTVARAVMDRLLLGGVPHDGLVRALARAVADRRLQVWSAHPDEQAALATTRLAGEVPDRPGPYAQLVVNNAAGNKIDYYLHRSLRYALGPCRDGRRTARLEVVLRNGVPAAPLPPVVSGRIDLASAPAGSTSLLVAVYLARGSRVEELDLDGVHVPVRVGRERGHPVVLLRVELPRGRDRVLRLRTTEPAVRAEPVVPVQPLVLAQRTVVTAARCG